MKPARRSTRSLIKTQDRPNSAKQPPPGRITDGGGPVGLIEEGIGRFDFYMFSENTANAMNNELDDSLNALDALCYWLGSAERPDESGGLATFEAWDRGVPGQFPATSLFPPLPANLPECVRCLPLPPSRPLPPIVAVVPVVELVKKPTDTY